MQCDVDCNILTQHSECKNAVPIVPMSNPLDEINLTQTSGVEESWLEKYWMQLCLIILLVLLILSCCLVLCVGLGLLYQHKKTKQKDTAADEATEVSKENSTKRRTNRKSN